MQVTIRGKEHQTRALDQACLSALPRHEIRDLSQQLEDGVWSKYLVEDNYDWTQSMHENGVSPTLFHGTSSGLLESVLERGLDPELNPLTKKDFEFVYRVYERVDCNEVRRDIQHIPRARPFKQAKSIGAVYRQESISTTLCLKTASKYAVDGPEKVERFLRLIQSLLGKDSILSDTERNQLVSLEDYYSQILLEHEPIVIAFQTRSSLSPIEGKVIDPFFNLIQNPAEYSQLVQLVRGERTLVGGCSKVIHMPDMTVRFNWEYAVDQLAKNAPKLKPGEVLELVARRLTPELATAEVQSAEITDVYAIY